MEIDIKIKLLEQYYKTCINQGKTTDFYMTLLDLVDFIKNEQVFNTIYSKLLNDENHSGQELIKTGIFIVNKLTDIWGEIYQYIEVKKVNNNLVRDELDKFRRLISNKTGSLDTLYYCINDAIRELYRHSENRPFLRNYIVLNKQDESVEEYLHIPERKEYNGYEKDYKRKLDSELWGQATRLESIYKTIKENHSVSFDDGEIKTIITRLYNYIINDFQNSKSKEGNKNKITVNGGPIKRIEFLKKDRGQLKVYINGNYNRPYSFKRKEYWSMLYDLAENDSVDADNNFRSFFNSNTTNPLYYTHGFTKTKILKQEDNLTVKNIDEIRVITDNWVTRQLKKT